MEIIHSRLKHLRNQDQLRTLQVLHRGSGMNIEADGRALINFSSNDYFGLSRDPRIAEAAAAAAREAGSGSGASRLISGSLELHKQLEDRLAALLGMPAALVLPSGYMANIGLLSAVSRECSIAVDRLCHASIYDGIILGGGSYKRYRHLDPDAAARALSEMDGACALVTDTVFSMQGDCAPLASLGAAARENEALLIVDEAHAWGVYGPRGRGLCAEAGVQADAYVLTFSKVLGCQGGIIAASQELIDLVVNTGRPFIYSTGLSPLLAGAALAGLDIIEEEGESVRARLQTHLQRIGQCLAELGMAPEETPPTPIIPLVLGDNANALAAAAFFREQGLLAVAIRPPTVPPGQSMIRISISAAHTAAEIERLCNTIEAAHARFHFRKA